MSIINKYRDFRIYCGKPYVWVLRLLFLTLALNFASEVYSTLESGVANAKHGHVFSRASDPFGFWLYFVERGTITTFMLYLSFTVREKEKTKPTDPVENNKDEINK